MSSLASCLVQWVKSFEPNNTWTHNIRSLHDLSDGLALWTILQNVDPSYFSGNLPESEVTSTSEWTRKWQNLKHIERQVSTYYRDICNAGQEQVASNSDSITPDLKAIAEDHNSGRELEKLVMVILRAAMASPESNQRMVQKLMAMGKEAATVIATELRNMEEVEEELRLREAEGIESVPMSRDGSAYHSEREEGSTEALYKVNGGIGERLKGGLYADPLLEREQELLHAQDMITKLQQGQDAALRQIQELRQDRDRLQEAFNAYRSEIDSKGWKTGGEDMFKKLQRQADNDKAYIEDLENQMQSSRNSLDDYERQLQHYRAEQEIMQKLRDDMQMLRTDNEDLQQKIKANENLKKKIQTLQEQEKSMSGLRDELKAANEKLEEFDRLRSVQASLEKEIIEKKGLIRNQEYQINELSTMRKHAEYDARSLAQKLQEARERQERDHEAIQELQARLQESNPSDSVDLESTQPKAQPATEKKPSTAKTDETKHISEKLILMEKQLEAADARLKQAAERNAALEEAARSQTVDLAEYEKIEQQARDYEKTIADLRRDLQLAAAEKQQKQKSEDAERPQDLASLQRENQLMTSAWYDLSSRLQYNGVSLGRRRPDPKSWIGKQRALVGPGAGLR